jgi:MoaA/NifB/PqqE/SkfB family radical SAM enzyme
MISSDNKSFCAVPFVSTMINVDATIRYCCMVKANENKLKKPDGSFYTCKENFIDDAWNSQDMRNIRLAMIEGTPITGCQVCYTQESSGRTSNRQHSVVEWSNFLGADKLNNLVEQALDNDGALDEHPVYLDLRLGNLCNLKCRMCNPYNSSQIYKEYVEQMETNQPYKDAWHKSFGKNFPFKIIDEQPWFDHDILWDQVISLIPKLKKVYMTGGEPTLIKNNFKFMQECIDQGRKDIVLFFNTNCTNVNKQFLELISQFDRVSINASLDGIGIVNEYIRAPSKWSQISDNIEKLAKLPNVNLGITPTIQVYNVFNIVDMMRWVEDLSARHNKKIIMDFLINTHPFQLNVNILSDEIRQSVLRDITEYISEHNMNHHPFTMDSIKGVIGLLNSPRSERWEALTQQFKEYTLSLDEVRDQRISDIDPRLAELCR